MASEQRRFTAAEWRDIQHEYRESPRRGVRSMYPTDDVDCDLGLGPFVPSQAPAFKPHAHLEVWFTSLSKEDVERLQEIIKLREETVKWISGKSPKELESIDGVVDFVSSSRTAAKVLMWVCGTTAAFLAAVFALTKNGFDLFRTIRGS